MLFAIVLCASCSPAVNTHIGEHHKLDKYERNGFIQTSDSCSFTVKNKTYVDQYFTVDQQTFKVPAANKKWIFKKKGKRTFKVAIGNHTIRDNVFDQTQLEVTPTLAYSHTYYGDASPASFSQRPWMSFFPDESHPIAPHNLNGR